MKFKMNNVEYIIEEVSQDYLSIEKIDDILQIIDEVLGGSDEIYK